MRSGLYGITILQFSALLNSSTASGLCSDYPGQVEGWVLKCTKKAYHFNEKQKAYLDAKFAIGQATGKKLDGDIVAHEMRRALVPDGVCLFKVSELHSKSRPTSRIVQPISANNFPMMSMSGSALAMFENKTREVSSAEGASRYGDLGACPPQKVLKLRGSELLF